MGAMVVDWQASMILACTLQIAATATHMHEPHLSLLLAGLSYTTISWPFGPESTGCACVSYTWAKYDLKRLPVHVLSTLESSGVSL